MKFFYPLLCLALSVMAHGGSPNWTLNNTSCGWNEEALAKAYFHNSELQRQWAWELLGKQGIKGTENILDFGCGDGKVSAEISRLVFNGNVTGVDISEEMLKLAAIKFPSYAYPNLTFKKSQSTTFNDIQGIHSYDMITSFCVFHLVPQPVEILKNLKNHLKPEGKLVLVIPAGKNPALFEAANETFAKYKLEAPWKKQSGAPSLTMRTLEGCSKLLNEAGYEIISLEMIDTDNPFYDKTELTHWIIGTITANWNVPLELSSQFFNDLIERMFELDTEIIDDEGRIHFKLSRIHAVAIQSPIPSSEST